MWELLPEIALKCILPAPNFYPIVVVKTQTLLNSHGGFLTNAMHYYMRNNLIK